LSIAPTVAWGSAPSLNSAVYLAFCICISPIQILTIIFVY